ncbi:MAG: anti-sigma factor [Pseudomonadota bacterium]
MTNHQTEIRDLLVARATEGLDDADAERLAELLAEYDIPDTDDYDLAAAAATNAWALRHRQENEAAPDDLKARLLTDADVFFDFPDSNVVALSSRRQPSLAAFIGWAAAACLLVALLINQPTGPGAPALDLSEARAQLLSDYPDTERFEWARPEDLRFANVTGDVVWNDELQQGYMVFRGMPVNDPQREQYQLWLVDATRDSYPVDGGVFDIPTGSTDVVVPIDAKLAVSNPAAFAITLEKPGGVVVSEGPLLVVASSG